MKREIDIIHEIDIYILQTWLNTGYAPSIDYLIDRFMPNDHLMTREQLSDLIYANCVEETESGD